MTERDQSTVTVPAPAKLTLSLRISGVRADGYHLIDAEMVTLEWSDALTIDRSGTGLTASGPFAEGLPLDDRNLVHRALQLCGRTAAVHIDKQLPHGGGLGGGSADAAAVLRWAGYGDITGASALGADVSFCLVGGRARVRGIGEIVEPLDHLDLAVTLVVPPLSVSTPAVYRAWDALPRRQQSAAEGSNDLQAAALVVEPGLAAWCDRIGEACGMAPTLAGSGATWFLLGHHPSLVEALPDAVVVLTRTDRPRGAVGDRRTLG